LATRTTSSIDEERRDHASRVALELQRQAARRRADDHGSDRGLAPPHEPQHDGHLRERRQRRHGAQEEPAHRQVGTLLGAQLFLALELDDEDLRGGLGELHERGGGANSSRSTGRRDR